MALSGNQPVEFQSRFVRLGDIDIHLVHNAITADNRNLENGNLKTDGRPVILFLHGFPEYHGAWNEVLPLLAKDFLVIAPDQRGFNHSSAPQELSKYQTRLLVEDMFAMMDELLPDVDYHLVGHDWGASIAYAMAMRNPGRINTLTVINGVHPIPFQRALWSDKDQIKASQYFHVLCAPNSDKHMSENGFARTFSMFEKFSSTPWLDEEQKQKYLDAWSRPGRMNAMLNWYRASPIIVPSLVPSEEKPEPEGSDHRPPLLDADPDKFRIDMPHLVLWGMQDTALLPVARSGLEEFAGDLKIVEIDDAGHWINHTHPQFIAKHIREFIAR